MRAGPAGHPAGARLLWETRPPAPAGLPQSICSYNVLLVTWPGIRTSGSLATVLTLARALSGMRTDARESRCMILLGHCGRIFHGYFASSQRCVADPGPPRARCRDCARTLFPWASALSRTPDCLRADVRRRRCFHSHLSTAQGGIAEGSGGPDRSSQRG
jgi:hypothetical protein